MPFCLCRTVPFLTALCLMLSVTVASAAPAAGTENPPTLAASALLPANVLSGPNHRVDEKVENDGYMNIYTLHTPKGDLRVESTALLYTRIHEVNAAAAMDQVNKGAEFGQSVAESGVGTVKGAVNLLIHPIDTLSGAASGVGKAFSRAEAGMKEHRPSDSGGAGAELLGYARTKREYAKAYGVDPYSTNPILQASLKRLTGAGFAGGLTATAAKVAIPGGVGLAVSAVGGTKTLNDIDVSIPPQDLLTRNRQRLQAMGVTTDVTDLFVENPHFTPTGQTVLVAALDRMPEVADRSLFVSRCILVDDDDVAFFRERMAGLYSNIHATVDRLQRFLAVDKRFVAARTVKGQFLIAFPLDYLAWTPAMVNIAKSFGDVAKASGATARTLVVSGDVSPLAAKMLQTAGWTVLPLRQGLIPAKANKKL